MLKKLLLACALLLGLSLSSVNAAPAHIVMMIGEDEYHTWETLPAYAGSDLKATGYRVTIVHADAKDKITSPASRPLCATPTCCSSASAAARP